MRRLTVIPKILILLHFFPVISTAQNKTDEYISKGTYSLSGSASYNEYDPESGPKTKDLRIGPKYLYFISNNISIGGGLNYLQSKFDGSTLESYGAGPVVRYYIQKNNILPFFSLGYS